jgi:iron(III) transport system ATP-binding protein
MTHPCLEVSELSHSYQNLSVLKNIKLQVATHSCHYVLGASGCGKSTLLRLICGLERPKQGNITCSGTPLSHGQTFVPPEKRRIGMVFQDLALFPHMTVLENITYGLDKPKDPSSLKIAMDLLASMQMEHLAHVYPSTLSGGQAQRVALARSLAPKPVLLLLDEPFSGLDVQLKIQVRKQTLEYLKKHQVTTMIVSHDPQEALEFGDFVTVLHEGKLVASGVPQDLFLNPPSAQLFQYFGETICVDVPESQIQDSGVQMPWGIVPLAQKQRGPTLQWIYRPEAILPSLSHLQAPQFEAQVLETQRLGPFMHVTLYHPSWGHFSAKFPEQIPLVEAPGQGYRFSINLKFSHLF